MRNKLKFTAICLQVAVFCFSQTEEQKQMMYERINMDSSGKGLKMIQKIEPIKNKETLFENARVFPVYHVELDNNDKPILIQNKDSYLVFYVGRLYTFFDYDKSQLFENRPEIKNINELLKNNKEFLVVYFTNYNYTGEIFNILFTDKLFSFILENDKKYSSLLDYIDYKHGSFDKYKEHDIIEKKRDKLTLKDINDAYKVNYSWYEKRCPKDTTLILKKFIDQIKVATTGFSKGQEIKLIQRIKDKLNPTEYFYNKYYKVFDADSKLKESLFKNKKEEVSPKAILFKGDYNFYIYEINIIQDLLEILTDKQFQDYKNYIDLYYPIVYDDNNLLTTERYTYGIEVFKKELNLKVKNRVELQKEYGKYFEKEFGPFDCPLDKSTKPEVIIR
jgi:hypothetical protein